MKVCGNYFSLHTHHSLLHPSLVTANSKQANVILKESYLKPVIHKKVLFVSNVKVTTLAYNTKNTAGQKTAVIKIGPML